MAHLAVLQPDPRAEARLYGALGGEHRVVLAHSWAGLKKLLAAEPVDGCIVDADSPGREEAVAEIRRIRQTHPGIGIVAYADIAEGDLELFRFGRIGVDGIVFAGMPERHVRIREAVDRALAFSRAERVRAALQGRYSALASDAVAWAVEHAPDAPDTETLASAMGRSRRVLGAALRADGLPSANRILVWGRLLLAGAYLARDGKTVEDAAFALRYSSANALGRAMKRETGCTPTEVASRGGMAFVQSKLFPRGASSRLSFRRPWKSLGIALLASVHWGCASAGRPTGVTPDAIDRILDAPPYDHMHFGVLAVDAASGRTLYARDAGRKFIPASNEKLLVTSTAWSILGPEYRYHTDLWGTAPARDGVVGGNLVLVGTGDPTLSQPFWASGEEALGALADSLVAAGIHRVDGALVVDVAAWDSTTVGPTWEADDLPAAYAATGGAFAIDRGELRVVARGGATPQDPPSLAWSPVGTEGFVTSRVVTGPADGRTRIRGSYLPESRRLVLEGQVRAGATDTVAMSIRDPVRQAAAALYRILAVHGVEIAGGWSVAWDRGAGLGAGCIAGAVAECAAATRLAGLTSPPLADIVQAILEPSQNWMAEQLVRTLGAYRGGEGSWPDGIQAVRTFLEDGVGVDSLDFAPRDGSGLSAQDLVTPRALVRILTAMAARPDAERFRRALAEPSEKGSTLEHRLSDLQGRLFAKTGTISNVNSLSGYLVGSDGQNVIFSILSNGSGLPSARVRDAIDHVVTALAGHRP